MRFKRSDGIDLEVTDAEGVRESLAPLLDVAYFAVLERAEDTYVQAYRDAPERFQLEMRLGSPDAHYERVTPATYAEVERAFVEFFEGREDVSAPASAWRLLAL